MRKLFNNIPANETVRTWSTTYTTLGYISFLSSFFVLLSFYLFRESFKGKYFMSIVLAISISDFLSGAFAIFGFTSNPGMCSAQGAFINFFFRSSWFFTTILSYQLRYLVVNGRLNDSLSVPRAHIITWGVSIILEILPLTTQNYYGADDGWIGLEPCYIQFNGRHSGSRNYMILVTFAIPLILCLGFMVYNSVGMLIKYRSQLHTFKNSYPAIYAAIEQSYMYPIALLICWFPGLILFVVYAINHGNVTYIFENIAFDFDVFYGFCMSLIFFSRSQIARREWSKLICKLLRLNVGDATANKTDEASLTDGGGSTCITNPMKRPSNLELQTSSRDAIESSTIYDSESNDPTPVIMISRTIEGGKATRNSGLSFGASNSNNSNSNNNNYSIDESQSSFRLYKDSVYFQGLDEVSTKTIDLDAITGVDDI